MNEMNLFDALFNGLDVAARPARNYSPKVDVTENETSYVLEMDLPGKTDKDVKIELNKNVLTIASEETKEETDKSECEKTAKWLLKERSTHKFSRSFTLPEDVDSENLSASCKDGVLKVNMPRKAVVAPRRIQINVAG